MKTSASDKCLLVSQPLEENVRKSPNDPKLSDRGVRRGTCTAGGKAAAEAGAVTHGAVRCSACLGVCVIVRIIDRVALKFLRPRALPSIQQDTSWNLEYHSG